MLATASRNFFYRHPGQLLLALVGVAAGVAVMVGVALLRGVLLDALDLASGELAGPDSLRVADPAGPIETRVYARLSLEAGAPDLVPVLRIGVRHRDRRLEVLGIDPFAIGDQARLNLSGPLSGEMLAEPVALASPRTLNMNGIEPDQVIELGSGQTRVRIRVRAALEDSPGLDDRLLMDIAQAQAIFGLQGRISELLAPPDARTWLVGRLPPGLEISDAGDRRESARRLTAGMRANLGAMSLLALATGLFVVFSVMSFLMVQRRRQFGILRALGVTRGRLAAMLSSEAAAIAALGGLAGLVAGTWLAQQLLDLVRGPVTEIYREIPAAGVQPGWTLYLLLWAIGVAAAIVAVAPVVREAMQVPPGRLVRGWRPAPPSGLRLWLTGPVPVLAGLVLIAASDGLAAGMAGLFLILAGLVLLAPAAGFRVLGLAGDHLPDGLARRGLKLLGAARGRLAPALSALTLAVALAAGMGMMILGFRGAVDDWVERLLRADLYVSAGQAALGPEWIHRAMDLDGVTAVSSVRGRTLADGLRINAYDLPEPAWRGFDWLHGDPDRARDAFAAGTGALASEPLARRLGLEVGDRLQLPTPAGALELEIGAIFRDYSSDRGFLAIDGTLYRARFDDPLRDSLGLYLDGSADPAQVQAQLLARTEPGTAIDLTGPADIRARTLAVFDRTFRISWALAALVGLIALVALTSALMALGLERGRDYATLRALGLTPRGLVRLVMLQTGAVAATAAILSIPLAVVIHLALSGVIQPRAFGWTLPLGWPPMGPLLTAGVLVTAGGVLAGLLPAWKILARPLAGSLRAR